MARVKGDLEDLAFYHLYPHQFAELESTHRGEDEDRPDGDSSADPRAARRRASKRPASTPRSASGSSATTRSTRSCGGRGIDISAALRLPGLPHRHRQPASDTYAALGVVHQTWRPIPGRFKDYIAMPKPNLYQSLHTTVVGDAGAAVRGADPHPRDGPDRGGGHRRPLALQGRQDRGPARATPTSSGCASCWSGRRRSRTRAPSSTTLKVDLYPDEVYVFTPKGDVFSFPRGATPLDFAYRVHTDLGHHCAGARVNGKLVPLRTPLQNGDMSRSSPTPRAPRAATG